MGLRLKKYNRAFGGGHVDSGNEGERRNGVGNRIFAAVLPAAVLAFLCLLLAPPALRYYHSPCLVREDCRYRNVTMEELLALQKQEQEQGNESGLLGITAWRYGEAGRALEPVSGKTRETGVAYVCGAMACAFPGKVLCGSYEQVMREGDCVITKELSYALFGSTDTYGCRLIFGGKSYRIAAVSDREESLLLLPEEKGRVDAAAFLFSGRERLREKMEAFGF